MPWGLPAHEQPLDEWLATMLYEASQMRGYRPTVGERVRCEELLGSKGWGRFRACYIDDYDGICLVRREFIPKLVDLLQEAATEQVVRKLGV